nr:heavy metal-associated isoprenylated plant protein 9 isoform X2 [Quercus suber]POF21599.1 heavy metal-associated isoprenylated plant protein 9 [Quercus suber]
MGEEVKQEQAKAEAKPEEKKEEKAEEKKEEEPKPPAPLVLYVDLHCVGCAKKIEKSIMKIRGVEGVEIDMAKNEVTIKGIVEPQAVCTKIMKKTKRRAKVLSPLPASAGELKTVELNVNMHCEACAEELKKKILKMRGVQTAVTEFSTGKVVVTGTMDENKLVDYVYRRTKKQARIVPQPVPEPEKKEENKEGEKPAAEEAKPEEKKEEEKPPEEKKEEEKPPEEAKKEEGNKDGNKGESNENKGGGGEEKKEEAKKEGEEIVVINNNIDEEGMKRMMYYYRPDIDEEGMKRMMYYYRPDINEEGMKRMMYYYQPVYVIERIPPPQLFSDENPNACCIS